MKKSGLSSEESLLNFLLGQVMRETSGKANPQIARQMILDRVFNEPKEQDVRGNG